MLKMSAFSVNTGRQTTTPLIDGVLHNRLVQQTMTHLLRVIHIYLLLQHFLLIMNKKMNALFCTLFAVSVMQKLFKSVKI